MTPLRFPFALPFAVADASSLAPPGIRLAEPLWLAAIGLVLAALLLRRRSRVGFLVVPFAAAWHRPSAGGRRGWPVALAAAGLVLLAGALARPQRLEKRRDETTRGYDLMLAVDLSGSMLSEDYIRDGARINRLQAIMPVIRAFVDNRPNDRIGVVLFAAKAYTLSPLSSDHAWLGRQLDRVHIGVIDPDATAIGDALGTALARLDQADPTASGRRLGSFVVLLTDGGNNSGTMDPMDAARIAQARGVPIYTIGAGIDQPAPYPIFDQQGHKTGQYEWIRPDLDEDLLHNIAQTTRGHFFRAADTDTIQGAFAAIDKAEPIEFQARSELRTTELFPWLALPGLVLVCAGALGVRPT